MRRIENSDLEYRVLWNRTRPEFTQTITRTSKEWRREGGHRHTEQAYGGSIGTRKCALFLKAGPGNARDDDTLERPTFHEHIPSNGLHT